MNNPGISDLIESLLYQSEGTALDFKKEQYHFSGADERKKSELLKDVLAFANSWRQTDAYILIGIKEVAGGRAEVVGCDNHFDDAQLQQFVNGKTHRKVTFSYSIYEFEGKKIGILKIPLQERPTYSLRDYGVVKKEVVYYRLGSSTATAKPEDTARMGKDSMSLSASSEPELHLEFANLETRISMSNKIELRSIAFAKSSRSLPTLESPRSSNPYSGISSSIDDRLNPDYWRECEVYMRNLYLVHPIGFVINNSSNSPAINVHLEIKGNLDKNITVFDVDSLPEVPKRKHSDVILRCIRPHWYKETSCKVQKYSSQWILSIDFGNIQPQQTVWFSDPVFIGCINSSQMALEISMYANNLSEMKSETLMIEFQVDSKPALSLGDLPSNENEFSDFIRDNSKVH